MSGAYYNDNEPFVCEWLKNLIAAGHLPAGDVDSRPIQEIAPDDLKGYTQAHFFAGIGGWAYALQLAGWEGPVWTGSCPCQPFSVAGRRRGTADARHLWPAWANLIRQCRPPIVFGEQVATGDGVEWFDAVAVDLEGMGYAVGAADLCAAGVGAPHSRQRLFFVAHAERHGWVEERRRVATPSNGRHVRSGIPGNGRPRMSEQVGAVVAQAPDAPPSWESEPSDIRVAHGFPGRVGLLDGYGNAIVPQVAAAFVSAYLELQQEQQREAA